MEGRREARSFALHPFAGYEPCTLLSVSRLRVQVQGLRVQGLRVQGLRSGGV
jgi:hypothetical protein